MLRVSSGAGVWKRTAARDAPAPGGGSEGVSCTTPATSESPRPLAPLDVFVLHSRTHVLRIKDSALRHGLTREVISHAYDMAVDGVVLDPDHDPPKFLVIGPDKAGNLLELIGGDLESGEQVIWHAMKYRPQHWKLVP